MKKRTTFLSILLTLLSCFTVYSCEKPTELNEENAVWHNGYTVPLDDLGVDGEMYLDNTSHDYYKKENGTWNLVGNKKGKKVKQKWDSDGKLTILAIGNSFSDDALWLLPNVLRSLGVTKRYKIHIANLYIGSCSLQTHYANLESESAVYEYKSNVGSGWKTTQNATSLSGILDDDWDYITLQQNSADVGLADTYSCIDEMIKLVEKEKPNAKIGWHMTWAFQQDYVNSRFETYNNDQTTMYNAIIDAVKSKVTDNLNVNFVIPNGTVVQNARTSFLGDTLTRDGYHLSKDIGRYMTALTYAHLTTGYSIDDVSFAPTGVSDDIKKVCIESVKNAIEKPYEITQSTFTIPPNA